VASAVAQAEDHAQWTFARQQLRPFWQGDTVFGESVLFIKDTATGAAHANLLYPIDQVLTLRNSAHTITYERGRDYQWTKGTFELRLPAGSRIVSRTPAELRRPPNSQKFRLTHRDGNGEILFGAKLEYHDLQTVVTYRHAPSTWDSSLPRFDPKALPLTVGKLRHRQPVSIVVLGDSISTGCNASGWAGAAPFQPAYPELLGLDLREWYDVQARMTNLSVGGTRSQWGLTMVDRVVAANPDLVILAFGMNDASGVTAEKYRDNIKAMVQKIRDHRPECEFILVATMLGNQDWTLLHQELFDQYRDALADLCAPGVALADLTSVWHEFLKRKKYWDLTGNGVNHPNDFGHRVYAQVITTLLH